VLWIVLSRGRQPLGAGDARFPGPSYGRVVSGVLPAEMAAPTMSDAELRDVLVARSGADGVAPTPSVPDTHRRWARTGLELLDTGALELQTGTPRALGHLSRELLGAA
jgi:hypothetical protein